MNIIRIKIIPCVNSTKNNFTCKSRDEIDYYVNGGYLSLLFMDIGLNPSNFSNPIIHTLQDLYTTVDKQINNTVENDKNTTNNEFPTISNVKNAYFNTISNTENNDRKRGKSSYMCRVGKPG